MAATAAKKNEPTQQDVCIDLPGETVQCWRSSDNIKVVLRKHRDVIFDLNLATGNSYTVESTASDFYNAGKKKLMYAKRRDVVTFKDGERVHLWVTRSFQGALILKCNGKTLMKIVPNQIDKHQYDSAATTKPAPIIVALGAKVGAKTPTASNPIATTPTAQLSTPPSSSAPIDEECSVVCVIDGTMKNIPTEIAEYLKKGGGKSGLAEIDPFQVATRNWIWGQVAVASAYAKDNWSWLRESLDNRTSTGFRLVSAQVKRYGGQVRFYFSGYSKYNTVFGRGGFGPSNERIISIFAGVGKSSSAFAAAAKSVAGSIKGNALISFIFGSTTAIAEWRDDVSKDGYDLTAALIMILIKTIVSALLVAAVVALFVAGAMFTASFAVPVIAVGALTVVASIGINYLMDAADKALGTSVTGDQNLTDGLAAPAAKALRVGVAAIQRSWDELMRKFPHDYLEITH